MNRAALGSSSNQKTATHFKLHAKLRSIQDVVDYQLCTGCGVCASVESARFRMGDSLEFGRRPFLKENAAPETFEALQACPGARLEHPPAADHDALQIEDLRDAWGPVYGVWEGYASDSVTRYRGSSGGAATALAAYCLEREGMGGVLHTAADPDRPYLNRTVMSTCRDELQERTGSRYAPASPGEALALIEQADAPCVFIGKPCDVAGVQEARRLRPVLDRKLGLVVAFFCAGTPSTAGTLALLRRLGASDSGRVTAIRYRGHGWPGMFSVRMSDTNGEMRTRELTYAESWGFLQRYRQWRCYVCPDHTGEFADVAVGDPWYREVVPGEPGKSLIVARTRRGQEIVRAAAAAGYLVLETEDPQLLPRSQPNLLAARGALWARLMVLRVLGAAVPRYPGFKLGRFWLRSLSLQEKLRSFTGTARRIFVKGLKVRAVVREWRAS